jgi:hypothetical protein
MNSALASGFVPSIRRVVAAVDAPSRQVDDDLRTVDFALPRAEGRAVPLDHAPRRAPALTAKDHHVMAVAMKGTRQDRSDLS